MDRDNFAWHGNHTLTKTQSQLSSQESIRQTQEVEEVSNVVMVDR